MKKGLAKKSIIALLSVALTIVLVVTSALAYDSFSFTTSSGISFDGLVTDDNELLAFGVDDGWNSYFVLGKQDSAVDPWVSTCYRGTGWHVGIYYNGMSDYYISPSGSTLGCGLEAAVTPSYSSDGKTLYVTYTITNTKKFNKNFAVWTYGLPVIKDSNDLDFVVNSSQMKLIGEGDILTISAYDGAVLWAGDYNSMSIENGGFKNLVPQNYSTYAGAAFYWDGLTLAGGESVELTVSFQLDSVNKMPSGGQNPSQPETTTPPETSSEEVSETTTRIPDPWDTDIPADHEHSYILTNVTAPTFTRASAKTYECSCGDYYQELVRFADGLANTAASDGEWYYISNNKVKDITTIANNNYGWWYVDHGKVNFDVNSIEHNDYGWWYLEGGKVNFGYDGFGSNSNGDWYCEGGQVKFNVTDVIQGSLNGVSAWWNVKNSQVDYSTTIAHNMNGWWYCENGRVNFNYTGLGYNSNGWWYCKDGKVDFSYNGIVPYGNASWYVKGGQVQFGYTGTYKVGSRTYNIKLGKVVS